MIARKQINKTLRISILGIISVLFVFSCFSTILSYKKPLTTTQRIPLNSLTQQADSDYRVQLKPNSLYSEKILGPGKSYMANFIDKIETTFRYQLQGQSDGVSGTYQVMAVLEAYDSSTITPGNKKNKIWDKAFNLIGPTKFNYKGNKADFKTTVPVNFGYYNQFCDAVDKAAGTNTGNIILTVRSKINTDVVTPKGIVHKTLNPSIEIPIGAKIFQIRKNPTDIKTETEYTVKHSTNIQLQKDRFTYSVTSAVLLLILALFGFSTKSFVEEPEKNMLSIIMGRYGDRIIETTEASMLEAKRVIRVAQFKDLIKAADDLVKPVFHVSIDENSTHLFFILDGNTRYESLVEPITFFARKKSAQLAQDKIQQIKIRNIS